VRRLNVFKKKEKKIGNFRKTIFLVDFLNYSLWRYKRMKNLQRKMKVYLPSRSESYVLEADKNARESHKEILKPAARQFNTPHFQRMREIRFEQSMKKYRKFLRLPVYHFFSSEKFSSLEERNIYKSSTLKKKLVQDLPTSFLRIINTKKSYWKNYVRYLSKNKKLKNSYFNLKFNSLEFKNLVYASKKKKY